MEFTQIPTDTFKQLQLNAGILCKNFDPSTRQVTDIIGATSGGVNFTATPAFIDFGEDIDNCPKNMKELKELDEWEVKMSGTFITVTVEQGKGLVGAADIDKGDPTKIVPRNTVEDTDFADIWWVGDYSDVNSGEKPGFLAIRLISALSTGGFQIQSGDKAKGQFAFEYSGHYSMANPDTVPFELFIASGESSGVGA